MVLVQGVMAISGIVSKPISKRSLKTPCQPVICCASNSAAAVLILYQMTGINMLYRTFTDQYSEVTAYGPQNIR